MCVKIRADICDMIKGNELDVADICVEILAKKEVKFFCFIMFSVHDFKLSESGIKN